MISAIPQSVTETYAEGLAALRRAFDSTGDGAAVLRDRTALVDSLLCGLAQHVFPAGPSARGMAMVALGGYGGRTLFPHSDVDLLFLVEEGRAPQRHSQQIAALCRLLWDMRLRVSPATRTLEECDQLQHDNIEFHISLLDRRLVYGDAGLFAALHQRVLPQFVRREAPTLLKNLAGVTQARHERHGRTVFHLEPNVKDTPGGWRDLQLTRWLTALAAPEHVAPRFTDSKSAFASDELAQAFFFLASVRCALHFLAGRDDNTLSSERQERLADAGTGMSGPRPVTAARWMQQYFRNARALDRAARRALDDALEPRSGLYAAFENWLSHLSNSDFSVMHRRIYLPRPAALRDRHVLLGLFEFMARHDLDLSGSAELAVTAALRQTGMSLAWQPGVWGEFERILQGPGAASALRKMQESGVLASLLPEFGCLDALVVRDFFHRYTVDEHTFRTIEHLHQLRGAQEGIERRFGELFTSLEQPALLCFALLMHDVGKGISDTDHVTASREAARSAAGRMGLGAGDRELVDFLIAHHLAMSATLQRRDIFDAEVVRGFAELVGTQERLKLLTLLTWADIRSVNPEAMTPWKAEMLWHLYAATANHLSRSLDDERVSPQELDASQLARELTGQSTSREQLHALFDGLPRRYLAAHSREEMALHARLAGAMKSEPVQVDVRRKHHIFELTVLAPDRPLVFASICGTLAAWGMNIVKAEAFANAAGTVVDTIRFSDPHRTLEMNPEETERLKESLRNVLYGRASLEQMLRGRTPSPLAARVRVPTEVRFDSESSAHCTLLELGACDRPGLLYTVAKVLAEEGCNIEVALADTEGQRAVDVFYLRSQGAKLAPGQLERLHEKLFARIGE